MNKQILTIAKLNVKNIKIPYFVTCLLFIVAIVQTAIYTIVAVSSGKAGNQLAISGGNYLWLLVILAAVFIPTLNLRKIVNLGGKRKGFFWGSMISYIVITGIVSLANTLYYYIFERFLINTGYYIGFGEFMQNTSLLDYKHVSVNLVELFGWSAHGVILVFIQQFVFLLLLASVIHTLSAMQDKWYGWVTDVIIAAILATFIPIASLRVWLLGFFNLIIFNSNPFMQIISCLILSVVVYSFSKAIFARKVI